MNMETFVENAKAICKNKNIAVSTACLNAGLSITWMSDIEKKHTRPRIDSVIAFAQYLGVTVSELLGETPRGDSIDRDLDPMEHWLLEAWARADQRAKSVVEVALTPFAEKKN